MKPTDFAYYLSKYFKSYMPGVEGVREKTITSYQTAFYIFLRFMKNEKGIVPDKITLDTFNVDLIMEYLQYIEDNGGSISTRNHRLTVLRSFFKYIQLVEPKQILLMQQLLTLKHKKRPEKPTVNYLTTEGIKHLTSEPVAKTKNGYRHMLLLSVLYETAARVSELTGIRIDEIRLEYPATVLLHGKGGKDRIIPISRDTSALIRNYLEKEKLTAFECGAKLLFTNQSGNKLTEAGVTHILKKYADSARIKNPRLIPKILSPHCLRHSKAMHLLQSGVDLIYIRDFLGHEHLKTTEIYAKTDSSQKRKVIEDAYSDLPDTAPFQDDWNKNIPLMSWLKGLCEQ